MPIDQARDQKDRQDRKSPRPEFEVAYYTKELGRPLQRRMLERQLAAFNSDTPPPASHHDDELPQMDGSPPRADRAG